MNADFDKKLDEIAQMAEWTIFDQSVSMPVRSKDVATIKRAMLAAIELYAGREPSEDSCVTGLSAMDHWNAHSPSLSNRTVAVKVCFRAMQAAQLKEIKEGMK